MSHNVYLTGVDYLLDYMREAARVLGQPEMLTQLTEQLAKGWEGTVACSCCDGQ